MSSTKRPDCRYCNSRDLTLFLSLGEQPPSNSFVRPDQIASEKRYPLDVYLCQNCHLSQLLDVVPGEEIFNEYLYLSSSSGALKKHYAALAQMLLERFGVGAGELVVDIGCNDGILLHGYGEKRPGLVKLGVEPSSVARVARESGLKVTQEFFSPEVARRIVQEQSPAKIITATNVFAHVDNISRFTQGVRDLLDPDGVFVIEAPYWIDMVEQLLFDTIYHEHLCYLSLTPMVPFFKRQGLEIFDVERVPFGASGPAIRVFAGKQPLRRPVQDSVGQMLTEEARWGIGSLQKHGTFAGKVAAVKNQILQSLEQIKSSGARLGGFGAPAKGNTLLNYLGLTADIVECIAENNSLKQGLLTPGSHIPIVSDEEFVARKPEYALLLTWNYLDFFLKNSPYIAQGGRFLVPLPVPRLAP